MTDTTFTCKLDATLMNQGDAVLTARGMTREQLLTQVYQRLVATDTTKAMDAAVAEAMAELADHPAPPISDSDWWAHLDPEEE